VFVYGAILAIPRIQNGSGLRNFGVFLIVFKAGPFGLEGSVWDTLW
jgi:hypothetical protein